MQAYGDRKAERAPDQTPGVNIQADPAAFGLGGRARPTAEAALEESNRALMEATHRRNQVWLQDLDTKLTESSIKSRAAFDKSPNSDVDVTSKKLMEEYDGDYNKIAAEAPNQAVADAVQRAYKDKRSSLAEYMVVTGARKFQEHDRNSTSAYMKLQDEMAVKSFENPGAVGEALARKLGSLAAFAERNHIKGPEYELLVLEETSKTHRFVIERMQDRGMNTVAKQYLETVRGQLTRADLAALEKSVQEGNDRQIGFAAVDKTFNQKKQVEGTVQAEYEDYEDQFHPSGPKMRKVTKVGPKTVMVWQADPPKSINEWIERINKELEGQPAEVIDYAEGRARRRWHDMEVTQDADHRKIVDNIGKMVAGGADFDTIPMYLRNELKFEEHAALKRYSDRLREPSPIETDWETYRLLRRMAGGLDLKNESADPDPKLKERFILENLSLYRVGKDGRGLGDTEYKELIALQAGLAKGEEGAQREVDGYMSATAIVNGTMRREGWADDTDDAHTIRMMADEEIRLWKFNHPKEKEIPASEVQTIIDGLLVKKVTEAGYIWDSKEYEFRIKHKIGVELKKIPFEQRRAIEKELRAAGMPVTQNNVMNLLNAKKKVILDNASK